MMLRGAAGGEGGMHRAGGGGSGVVWPIHGAVFLWQESWRDDQ